MRNDTPRLTPAIQDGIDVIIGVEAVKINNRPATLEGGGDVRNI